VRHCEEDRHTPIKGVRDDGGVSDAKIKNERKNKPNQKVF